MAEGAFEARTLAAVLNKALLPLATLKADLPRARDMAWRESCQRKIIPTLPRILNIPSPLVVALLHLSYLLLSIRVALDQFQLVSIAKL